MSTITLTDIFDHSKMDSDDSTLSSRLLLALTRLKINQSELARRLGIKPQMIQYLCTSKANKSKFAYEIATALEINPNWLIAGKGAMRDLEIGTDRIFSQQKILLLSWSNITKWLDQNLRTKLQGQESISVTAKTGLSSFALKITDTSMIPRFEPGTILIIDPELKAKEGDFVVIQTVHQEQPILRQLLVKNKKNVLMPINTAMYREIELTSEDKILGVLHQTYYEFVRL
jgi:SOS-response transcriptional repressor LexA